MKRVVLWTALAAGLLILGLYARVWVEMAIAMRRFGGIPFSYDFFRLNPRLIVMPAIGLVLATAALNLLVRRRG